MKRFFFVILWVNLCAASRHASKHSPEIDLMFLSKFAEEINQYLLLFKQRKSLCKLSTFGSGFGEHILCDFHTHPSRRHSIVPVVATGTAAIAAVTNTQLRSAPHSNAHDGDPSCYFLSFGTSFDYSFDTDLHRRKHCSGIALDPTESYLLHLTPGVVFWQAGANMLNTSNHSWTTWSVPALRKWWGHDLFALKMDCEGCEYALARDVMVDDPHFFSRVTQVSIELHLPRTFMTSSDEVYALGRLYQLMHEAGLVLAHADDGDCGPDDKLTGFQPLLIESNFPTEMACRSFLFVKKTFTEVTDCSICPPHNEEDN